MSGASPGDLDRGWTRRARGLGVRADQRALLERFEEIPPAHGVVHGRSRHQHNRADVDEASLHPLPQALVRAGDLWHSALELREDHQLSEPEPWVDEQGRTRHRWSTTSQVVEPAS